MQPANVALNDVRPLTSLTFGEALRFVKPVAPKFDRTWSFASIASLFLMAAVANRFLESMRAAGLPAWNWVPFLFTVFGSGLGMVFEVVLVANDVPFQQTYSPAAKLIRRIRLLNLAPVTASIFYAVCCLTIGDPDLRVALLYGAAALAGGLGFALFWGGAEAPVGIVLLTIQLAQVALVLGLGTRAGGWTAATCLVGQAVAQASALRIGTADPKRSTAFHVLSTLSGVLLYGAMRAALAGDPGFANRVAVATPNGPLAALGFLAMIAVGVVFTARNFPLTYGHCRAAFSNALWSGLYFLLVSEERFPNPKPLREVYGTRQPPPIGLKPYHVVHPQHLVENLAIPAAETLEHAVRSFADLLKRIEKVFGLLSHLDAVFPHVDARAPLATKPRIEGWSDGQEYWPRLFLKTIRGRSIPGQKMDPAPAPLLEAFGDGQLLAYLCESGIGSAFLARATGRGPDALVADFRFLEDYETKPDYEPYGGVAYFTVNRAAQCLELVSVVAPRCRKEIRVNPADPAFRRAEAMIAASLYYQVISGKHLAEIHMTYNLVEVALHNAFDATGGCDHPVRTMLYLHFFSHALAEELTTEHLVQQRAVFAQIFATTHTALIRHLNDCYRDFHFGADEDFDARLALLSTVDGTGKRTPLPRAAIGWELRYVAIWNRYATAVVEALYPTDAEVVADTRVQGLHAELERVLLNGMPARYAAFQTKAGLARFLTDTIHHCVIRHEVYGTMGVRGALDPRIGQLQVPRDGGPPGVEEWRSVACIGLATSRTRFTPLLGDYKYLFAGAPGSTRSALERAFDDMQRELGALQEEWTRTAADVAFNYDYFRAVPVDLDTGPGY